MELLSTVHWVATNELEGNNITDDVLISTVHSWNARKSQMKPAHILAALNKLKQEDWLNLKAQTV
ncbi:hypothetical protein [Pseudoalteromonas sp. ASV78]|uniref:hypothetical protein n=1 Tax=Pseudoalteromonas sp. ASV78 TaxID=3397851 RepID=UPI0039FD012B